MKLRLKNLREDQDIKQRQLAAILNCTQQTYSRYENGQATPTLEALIQLADYYHTSVDYLLGVTDEKAPYPRAK